MQRKHRHGKSARKDFAQRQPQQFLTLIKVRGVAACNGLIEVNRDTAVASNDATTFHAFHSSLLPQQATHSRAMIHTISQIRVRYAETDRMDVVYHSNYLVWFETARILMLDEIGIPYLEIEASNLHLPVLTASAVYKRPARFDDRLEIHLFMRAKPRARFHFDYEVRRGDPLLATGSTSHGFMDTNGKALRPPAAFLAKIDVAWKPEAGAAIDL